MERTTRASLVKDTYLTYYDLYGSPEEQVSRQKERVRSSTKTRKSAITRRRIMETTSDLMVERGNTAFQMSEISRRCGMSKGALYYYFADKEDLLAAIYEDEINLLVHSIDDAVKGADTAEQALRDVCSAYANCVRGGGPLTMALVRELLLARDTEEGTQSSLALHHIIGVVAQLIDRAKKEGFIKLNVDERLTAVSVCGAFAFAAMSASDPRSQIDESTFAEKLFEAALQGIGA